MTQQTLRALRDALDPLAITDPHLNRIMSEVEPVITRLTTERDAARTEAARVRLAWTSARRGRAQATSGVDYLLGEVDTAMKAVAQLVKERDRLRARVGVLEERQRYSDAARAQAAQSMRDRAAQVAETLGEWSRLETPADRIRALPLLADVVHADLPEGVTPCGLGTRDVASDVRVSEVTCLDCLRTLAATRVGDQLPAEDLVEPGDEVPDLVELEGRLDDLEMRLSAVEDRLSPPTTQAAPAADLPPSVRELRRMVAEEKAAAAEPAPCEVCGRAPADQETGPDGACRHTPATRLGKPAGGES